MNLMLQAGPEIHGYRTDLYFYLRIHCTIRQIYRYAYDHVIAFVTAGLGISNVIFHSDHLNISLIPDHVRDPVDIGRKRTNNADSRNVIYVLYHIIYRRFLSVTFQFLDNTFRCLDPCLNMFDRIVLMYMLEFIIQDLHLRLHLTQRRTVYQRNLLPAIDSIPIFNLKLHIPSQSLLSQKALRPFCHISYFHRRFFVTKIPYSYVVLMIIIAYLLLKMYNFNKTFIIF